MLIVFISSLFRVGMIGSIVDIMFPCPSVFIRRMYEPEELIFFPVIIKPPSIVFDQNILLQTSYSIVHFHSHQS